jgi:hypothetical protein
MKGASGQSKNTAALTVACKDPMLPVEKSKMSAERRRSANLADKTPA